MRARVAASGYFEAGAVCATGCDWRGASGRAAGAGVAGFAWATGAEVAGAFTATGFFAHADPNTKRMAAAEMFRYKLFFMV